MRRWWFRRGDGEEKGPVLESDLRWRISVGLLMPNDMIRGEDETEWRRAEDVEDFFSAGDGSTGDAAAAPSPAGAQNPVGADSPAAPPVHLTPPTRPMAQVSSDPASMFGRLIPANNPAALTSYYTGLFSLVPVLGLVLGLVSIIAGGYGLLHYDRRPDHGGKVHAMVGILISVLSVVVHLTLLFVMLVD